MSREAAIRLLCFPHAGASARVFAPFQALGPEVEVIPLELAGRGQRILEDPRWSMDQLIPTLLEEVEPYLDRSVAFFGHSMGALLAYETARALFAEEPELLPDLLLLSGHRGPQLPRDYLRGHEADDESFVAELRKWAGSSNAWLDDPELRALFLPVLRADFTALRAYQHQPGPPLPCPFRVFGSRLDPFLDSAALEAWRPLSARSVTIEWLPGDHFYFLNDPSPLLERLGAVLAELRPSAPELS